MLPGRQSEIRRKRSQPSESQPRLHCDSTHTRGLARQSKRTQGSVSLNLQRSHNPGKGTPISMEYIASLGKSLSHLSELDWHLTSGLAQRSMIPIRVDGSPTEKVVSVHQDRRSRIAPGTLNPPKLSLSNNRLIEFTVDSFPHVVNLGLLRRVNS